MGPIRFLPPEEARKIAAGEVIDRPAALVREFIDNAVDAGGSLIEVKIEDGGIKHVDVSDDGSGIGRSDLEIACGTHSTSKIRSLDDLSFARTMGFRGEALAAACASSRLEILTSIDGEEGWRLSSLPGNGGKVFIEPSRRAKGTSVRASGLFDTMPARKRFLKREASEALFCRQIFVEKALAFYGLAFRFIQDGKLRLFFPAVEGYKERFLQAVLKNSAESRFLYEICASGSGYSINIVVGGPEIYRAHRRDQFVFANNRRINDYALQQALEYGSQGAFPNGTHPVCAIFLDINPALTDFNVHPAKREAKFAVHDEIHHSISSSVRVFFHKLMVSRAGINLHESEIKSEENQSELILRERGPGPDSEKKLSVYITSKEEPARNIRFIGYIFGLFILVEYHGRFFAIDQHAAHERILYNKFLKGPILRQELLVPITFITEDEASDVFLESSIAGFERLGLVISGRSGNWSINALPALWRLGDDDTVRAILELKNSSENIAERWAATIACHAAIKDGEALDEMSAASLALDALELPLKACPHGRPVLVEIEKEYLLKAVRRL